MRVLRHLFVFSLLILAAVILRRSVPPLPALTQVDTPQEVQGEQIENTNYYDYEDGGVTTRVRWIKVEDIATISLLANYDNRVPSPDAYTENACRFLTSGGFYDVEHSPIGLVVSNREVISPFQKNNLLNGILSVNEFDTPRITRIVPADSLVYAVQSGPVLWENGSQQKLSIQNDEPARRIVAAVTGSNELIYLVFYNPNSVFLGPMLSQLPEGVQIVNEEFEFNIADAINLDGGSASVFITPEFSLSEISPVGSFWCVK